MRLAALCLFTSMLQCVGQGTLQIVFEGPPLQPAGTDYYVQQYFESGISFRPLGVIGPGNGFGRVGSGFPLDPDNGTAYLRAALGDSLVFSFINGDVFNLDSVDLAEYSTVVPDAVTAHFVGYHQDGSTVTVNFITDGIIDGTGPLADFQTFSFGPEFSGLTRVEIPTFGWSLDNLMLSVPEPTSGILLAIGGLTLGVLKLHNRCGE